MQRICQCAQNRRQTASNFQLARTVLIEGVPVGPRSGPLTFVLPRRAQRRCQSFPNSILHQKWVMSACAVIGPESENFVTPAAWRLYIQVDSWRLIRFPGISSIEYLWAGPLHGNNFLGAFILEQQRRIIGGKAQVSDYSGIHVQGS